MELFHPQGAGPFVLVCEHASHLIPTEFDNLGLSGEVLRSHIAWDAGALEVARRLSERLDAPLVAPRVSRLVCDCNRPLEAKSSIVEESEIYTIPGNLGLMESERQERIERFYLPFHEALANSIERQTKAGRVPAVVTIHSFTPVYHGVPRALDMGIIHDEDDRLANALLAQINDRDDLTVRRNEPYGPEDGVTFTLVKHAVARGLPNVMVEIRNDLIASEPEQRQMAETLSDLMANALASLALGREKGDNSE